MDNILFYY